MTTAPLQLETIDVRVEDGVAILTLDRPEKRNAINGQMHGDLATALDAIEADPNVRALLLTANGPSFCAGQDLTEVAMARADDSFRIDEHVRTTFNVLVLRLRALEMPVIAAMNGIAAGAGWSIALAADLRIAADDASFTQAFSKIGLVPDTGSTWFLPELIGTSRTLQLAYSGEVLDVDTALSWGLVNEVVPADELLTRATAVARELAAMPTRALAMTRRAVYAATTSTLEEALELEAQLQHVAAATHDHVEGVTAFLEKRTPNFTGS
ncbi:MAG: Phenylacetate degradation, enoyl-CoA hydratase paaB [Thermoleophilia bacterium]|nr:Phenylacetate degradation, enoyl-CoA hydratase paaB [Thermoleophilia bacterium]MCZ4496825.1 Phenylacetate degradation, enoyl-CoA hydratase paaB [Thermoleophilia bacterium]